MNYFKPSRIQATALPLIIGPNPRNLICQSQTGTGKTAAFALAMIHRVDPKISAPQALCVAPTRELARQTIGYINTICQYEGEICTGLAIPGYINKNGKPMESHIVVGTPGTVMDCLRRNIISAAHMKILVMDEADSLLDMQGLGDHAIRVKQRMPPDTQFLLFSATFSDKVLQYGNHFAPNAIKLTLERHELTMKGIKQIYMDCKDEEDKYRILVDLYHTMCVGSSIVFVKVCGPLKIPDHRSKGSFRSETMPTRLPNACKLMATWLPSCMLAWSRRLIVMRSLMASATESIRCNWYRILSARAY
jgi:ATP-dependent RNA helicase DDX19/DBP5